MNRKKIFITVAILIIAYLLIQPTKAQAALQANGGESAKYNVNQWITGIRQMQATGGALGLTDTIDATKLTSNNTNLDIHMQKNTEYGAMILLSASAYGNPNKIESGDTTTGNATGVVMQINNEWTAAGMSDTAATSMANAVGRYKNIYGTTYEEKKGDATATVWHGATGNVWFYATTTGSDNRPIELPKRINEGVLVRSCNGSVFSYNGYAVDNKWVSIGNWREYKKPGHHTNVWSSRAVVVVGSGV